MHRYIFWQPRCIHSRIVSTDRGEHRQAAGTTAEAVIRSVELIVYPETNDVVSEMSVRVDLSAARAGDCLD
jgi:hypothetical protein